MKRVSFVLLMLVIAYGLNAQTTMSGFMDNFRFEKIKDGTYSRYSLKMSEIQGTPYLDESFDSGTVTTSGGITYENIPLRYNAFSDELEFKKGDDTYNIDPKTIVKLAKFGNATFTCSPYDAEGKTKNGFFELLADGKAKLFIRYTVKFLDKEEVKAYADPKPARFEEPRKEYFLAIDNAPAQLITNKKNLLEMFGDRKKEMETYISKNKLSVKGDDALTRIIVYYNSL